MVNDMEKQQIKLIVMQELPKIIQQDAEVRQFILDLSQQHYAGKAETESRFDRIMDELRRDRKENTHRSKINNVYCEVYPTNYAPIRDSLKK